MTLQDVFPEIELRKKFDKDVFIFRYGFKNLNEIIKEKSDSVFQTGARSWDRFVHMNQFPNPRILLKHFEGQNPLIYKEVAGIVGAECLHDIAYIKAVIDDGTLTETKSAELLIANIYPGELHIADIQLLNPYVPINPQKHAFQPFKGLGLMSLVVDKCKEYCAQHEINIISLIAAEKSLIPVFERFGFKVEDSPTAQIGLQFGQSIPMTLVIL